MSEAKVDLPPNSVMATATAPVNIAVIKYWGKRDTSLILPVNSSLSGTIDPDTMQSKTTIVASKSFEKDSMTLNGKEEAFSSRITRVVEEIRARASDYTDENGNVLIKKEDWAQYKIKITSNNNFPTAAGLASSASGYACLAKCLSSVYGMKETFDGELSAIARQGSGSASRSLYGGFVKWVMGEKDDGSDSYAVQVAPESHWEDMRVLILVVNSGKKGVSSTSGMQTSVLTSPLMKYRAEQVVPQRMKDMEAAIKDKNFDEFAKLTMADSNQFHACCLDTYPPIFYMNDTSKRIVSMVHALNERAGEIKAAYTFDAGPNAVIYLRKQDLDSVFNTFLHYFRTPEADMDTFITDPLDLTSVNEADATAKEYIDAIGDKHQHDLVKRIIVSKLGAGAQTTETKHSF